MRSIHQYIVCLFCFLLAYPVSAQVRTGMTGVVVDAETGETLPGVQIYFVTGAQKNKPTAVGTTSDLDGNFSISNTQGYTTLNYSYMGYKTGVQNIRLGKIEQNMVLKMRTDAIGLEEVIVKPTNEKGRYKRKGNPAVELAKNVIARKDSSTVKSMDFYTAKSYTRISFALSNFHPDFTKRFWKQFAFAEKYIDTTTTPHSLTIDIREQLKDEYYSKKPRREKHILMKKRIFGVEDIIGSEAFQKTIDQAFKDVEINDNNMNLLFNRFVSPLSSSLAISYYQYYIQDTIMLDGERCIDLAFVPVNSQSYSFTGHLYILDDGSYQVKEYKMDVPRNINLNFISNFTVHHKNKRLPDGKWAPDRTNTQVKFYLYKEKYQAIARQTKIYTNWDFETPINPKVFSAFTPNEYIGPETDASQDSMAVRLGAAAWDTIRPEPLTRYETSIYDMVEEFEKNPLFNSLTMLVNAITTEYVTTAPGDHMWDSKFDFGPIYNFFSWNMLEGARLRVGGVTTANAHPHWFFQGYVAFGTKDLRPKYNATVTYSFNAKKYHPYEWNRHYLSLGVQYDVEEPFQSQGIMRRDNILMSIPTSKPTMPFYHYVFHAKLDYVKEWTAHFLLHPTFDFSHTSTESTNNSVSALHYYRVLDASQPLLIATGSNPNDIQFNPAAVKEIKGFYNYDLGLEFRYTPAWSKTYVDRGGNESPFAADHEAPVIRFIHHVGFLDDRSTGGRGFLYNTTEISAEKRFWLSSFGHVDARVNIGYCWNQVPFMKLYSPETSTSVFLNQRGFNAMLPMEFLMDRYVGWYATYYFKGWILNRIPGINRLKLRGVCSFSGIAGYLSDKNNPYKPGNEGLYCFPEGLVNASFDDAGRMTAGRTGSPIDYHMPYMELTAGLENIFKFIRIDYIRRLTYNEYDLPIINPQTGAPFVRKLPAWGRNGVKVTVRFTF